MKKHNEICFIKPCRNANEKQVTLTPEYTISLFKRGRIVQINLDNCSIQRMEKLPCDPTIKDAQIVGLLPLVNILQNGNVLLTAMGAEEMPDVRVDQAKSAYHNFCSAFWPSHKNDPNASAIIYNESTIDNKIEFTRLDDRTRLSVGSSYIAFLQIQNIKTNYSKLSPEEQFGVYIHSIIAYLNIIYGYELEIAKYAFWSLSSNEINQLPKRVHQRRKDIKQNFTAKKNTYKKCKSFALGAAMDSCLLSFSNFAENLELTFSGYGNAMKIESWVGTHDRKLYNICRDIYSIYHEGITMSALQTVRDDVMTSSNYWKKVDELSKSILKQRDKNNTANTEDLLSKIDSAVNDIEQALAKALQ